MKITLEVTITGLDGWDVDWSNDALVKVTMADVAKDARQGIMDAFGIPYTDVEVQAEFESGN
jgi:hypothetical protein